MSNYSELYQRPSIWISSLVPNRIHSFATILFHILSFINDSQGGLLHLEKLSYPQKNCMIKKYYEQEAYKSNRQQGMQFYINIIMISKHDSVNISAQKS